jgi:hypothetical protein
MGRTAPAGLDGIVAPQRVVDMTPKSLMSLSNEPLVLPGVRAWRPASISATLACVASWSSSVSGDPLASRRRLKEPDGDDGLSDDRERAE